MVRRNDPKALSEFLRRSYGPSAYAISFYACTVNISLRPAAWRGSGLRDFNTALAEILGCHDLINLYYNTLQCDKLHKLNYVTSSPKFGEDCCGFFLWPPER